MEGESPMAFVQRGGLEQTVETVEVGFVIYSPRFKPWAI